MSSNHASVDGSLTSEENNGDSSSEQYKPVLTEDGLNNSTNKNLHGSNSGQHIVGNTEDISAEVDSGSSSDQDRSHSGDRNRNTETTDIEDSLTSTGAPKVNVPSSQTMGEPPSRTSIDETLPDWPVGKSHPGIKGPRDWNNVETGDSDKGWFLGLTPLLLIIISVLLCCVVAIIILTVALCRHSHYTRRGFASHDVTMASSSYATSGAIGSRYSPYSRSRGTLFSATTSSPHSHRFERGDESIAYDQQLVVE